MHIVLIVQCASVACELGVLLSLCIQRQAMLLSICIQRQAVLMSICIQPSCRKGVQCVPRLSVSYILVSDNAVIMGWLMPWPSNVVQNPTSSSSSC